jgi:hypothetical protein
MLLLVAQCCAAADEIAGTYRDERLTLTINKGVDGYVGTLRMAGKTFPLRAKPGNDGLSGEFSDGAAAHPFTCTVDGGTLVFKTGATTYRLQRQAAAVVPDKPLDLTRSVGTMPEGRTPVTTAATPVPPAQALSSRQQQIEASLKRAREYLYKQQSNANWDVPARIPDPELSSPIAMKVIDVQNSSQWGGLSALAVYALLASGESEKDPRLAPAIEWLKKADLIGTYAAGTRLQVWNALPGASRRKDILELAKRDRDTLLKNRRTEEHTRGMFRYSTIGFGYDHSASQFGVLGLYAASQLGAEVPAAFWKDADAIWTRNQDPSGGWDYGPEFKQLKPLKPLSLSMTAAGVATLFITSDALGAGAPADCRGNLPHKAIDAGIRWIVEHYAQLPKEEWPFYTLYGIERIGLASGYKYLGTIDWYRHGADSLLAGQFQDGSWGGNVPDTCFAMLFLSRGRSPLVMSKLQYSLDTHGDKPKEANWNQRPRDAANVTRWLSRQLERELSWQIVNLAGPVQDLLDGPILYISGNQSLAFTPDEEEKLRQFVRLGGLIVGHADCSHAYFTTSFKRLGARLFPPLEFRDLPAGHVIYSNLFNRERWKGAPPVQGLSNGARELMILLPGDPARFWQTGAYLGHEWSHEILANLFLYVNERRDLRFRGDSWLVAPRPDVTPTRTIPLARLQHEGLWDPEPGGWARLAAVMHNESQTTLAIQDVKLGEGKLAQSGCKIAHLTSTSRTKLTDPQRAELKTFLQGGGTLIVDAAGGLSDAASGLEAEIALLVPGGKLDILPTNHPAYANLRVSADTIAFRPFAARRQLGQTKGPRLRAVSMNDRAAIFYSPEDLSVGLVGQPIDGITGYTPDSATALMQSVLVYVAGR